MKGKKIEKENVETLEGLMKKVFHEENKTIMCRYSASVVSRIGISPVLLG